MSNVKKTIFYIILALIVFGVILFIYYFSDRILKIMSPLLIAVIIAYIIYPLVIKFERKGLKRSISIIVIYSFILLVLVFFSIYIMPYVLNNAKELFSTLPSLTNKYQELFNSFVSKIKTSGWPPEVKRLFFTEIDNTTVILQLYMKQAMKKSLGVIASSITILINIVLSMIIAYYFLKDINGIKRSTLMIAPKRMRNELVNIGRELNAIMSHFIQGQLLTACIVGILETLGLFFVHVKYPFVLGLIGGIANIIPYFGPFLGAIPAVAIAVLDSPSKALLTILVFIIVQQIDNAFISPKIIEGKLGLHPVTTIVAVLIGGEFFGIIGMLIGVPVTAMLKVLIKRMVDFVV